MVSDQLICTLNASYEQFQLSANFTVREGELACLIGPSGCGKSTTLQLIAGLLPLEEGTITLGGIDLSKLEVHQRQIAMVFQAYALFPHMDVGQNIAYPLKLRKVARSEQQERVDQLLKLVSLSGYEKRRVDELSGGEQQRIALARALASDPQLLLLDEPLSALDAKLRKHLREEIRRIHDETRITTIYVTHDQEEALSIADRIIVMRDGQVVQSGTPEEIYHAPASLFVATFIGEGNTIDTNAVENDPENDSVLFFRPEQVTAHRGDSSFEREFLPHYLFDDAFLESCEFQGGRYRLRARWKEWNISCYSDHRPKGRRVTLSVRKKDTLIFPRTNE